MVEVSSSSTLVLSLLSAWTISSALHWAGVISRSWHLFPLNMSPLPMMTVFQKPNRFAWVTYPLLQKGYSCFWSDLFSLSFSWFIWEEKKSDRTACFPTMYCLDVTEHWGCHPSSASCMKPITITILLMSEDHTTEQHRSTVRTGVHLPPSVLFALKTGNKWKDNKMVLSQLR